MNEEILNPLATTINLSLQMPNKLDTDVYKLQHITTTKGTTTIFVINNNNNNN